MRSRHKGSDRQRGEDAEKATGGGRQRLGRCCQEPRRAAEAGSSKDGECPRAFGGRTALLTDGTSDFSPPDP